MNSKLYSGFQFVGYKVTDVDFKINKQYDIDKVESNDNNFSLAFSIEVNSILEEQRGIVTITADISKDYKKMNRPFFLKIIIAGFFSVIDGKFDDKQLQDFLKYNGTTALFPFLRSVVSDITKSAGVDPVMLPLVNIAELMKENQKSKPSTPAKKTLIKE